VQAIAEELDASQQQREMIAPATSMVLRMASGSLHPAISRLQKSGHDGQGSVCAAAQRVLMNLDVPWRSR
jgi:hypothetical protein